MASTPDAAHAAALSTLDRRSNHCFGCGPDNPNGLHLHFAIDASDAEHPVSTVTTQLDRTYEGPPGYLHGGLIATLLDEAMSKLNRPLGVVAVTRNMQIDYLRPVPLNEPITIIARNIRREGRKLFHHGVITHESGTVLAEAQGLFIAIDQRILAAAGLAPQAKTETETETETETLNL